MARSDWVTRVGEGLVGPALDGYAAEQVAPVQAQADQLAAANTSLAGQVAELQAKLAELTAPAASRPAYAGSAFSTLTLDETFKDLSGWNIASGRFGATHDGTAARSYLDGSCQDPANVLINDAGNLVLRADRRPGGYKGYEWASSGVTHKTFGQNLGHWETKLRIPSINDGTAHGLWTGADWMSAREASKFNGQRPEFDKLETFHGPWDGSGANSYGGYRRGSGTWSLLPDTMGNNNSYVDPTDPTGKRKINLKKSGFWTAKDNTPDLSGDWHVFGLEWTDEQFTLCLDGKVMQTVRYADFDQERVNPDVLFDVAMYPRMNMQIIDRYWTASTVGASSPLDVEYEYVRVWA